MSGLCSTSSSIVRFSVELDLPLKERVETVEKSLWTQEDVESEQAILPTTQGGAPSMSSRLRRGKLDRGFVIVVFLNENGTGTLESMVK